MVVCAVQAQAGTHKDGNRLRVVGAASQAGTSYLATEQHRTPLALPNHNCPYYYWGTEQIMKRDATKQNCRVNQCVAE